MELGNIVEYIDLQKIVCAVVLEIKNHRVGLLTESNREVNLSVQRLSHKGKMQLDLSMGRNKIVDSLKKISNRRESLINNINIKEVWEVLKSRDEWIDLPAMTHLCFPDNSTCDHESAVIRAFFNNRTYFKFDCDRFFPNPEETVEQLDVKEKETVRINRLIEEAGLWVRNAINKPFSKGSLNGDKREFAEILKSSYLLGKESVHYQTAKAILKKAGIEPNDELFRLFVALGIFDEDENIDLHKLGVPVSFPNNLSSRVDEIKTLPDKVFLQDKRKDLTDLSVITIDGQSTLDFDDAISIE
ncbi:MAG: exoribonuclease II, partial [Desulfobacterium sp.]|nr:exoribonuclease II [Desulfobacterium sp.]